MRSERALRTGFSALLAAALVTMVIWDGVAEAPRLPRSRVRPVGAGGVWGCPVVSGGRGAGWLNLANAGAAASHVRVRWVGLPKPRSSALTVLPGRTMTVPAPAAAAGVGAIVEWAGGELVASRTAIVRTRNPPFAIGASCSRAGHSVLAAAGLSTVGGDADVVLLNPSAADALVEVAFLVDGDEQIPESTRNRVVPARGRLVVRAGDFVFDKGRFAALVRVTTGSVVADVLRTGPAGGLLMPATAPLTSGAAVTDAPRGPHLELVAVGDDPAAIDAATMTSRAREATAGFPPGLDPEGPAGIPLNATGAMAVSLVEREGSPFVGSLVFSLRTEVGADVAAVPVGAPAVRWLAVGGPPAAVGSDIRVVVANPGDRPALVSLRLLGPAGPVAGPAPFTLPGGRASSVIVRGVRSPTFAVEVTAGSPVVVSLVGTTGGRGRGVVFTIAGVPAEPPDSVLLEVDPRTGVDAR